MPSRFEASPWLVVPVGFLISALGVFILEPMLVDLIVQSILELPEESRSTPMLGLDLCLSTATLVATLYVVAWWSRRPKVLSTLLVALLVLVGVALLVSSSSDLPTWYQWSGCLSVAVAWLLSGLLYTKLSPPPNPVGRLGE